MASRVVTIEEPTYGELEDIRIVVNRTPGGDATGIHVSYILKDNLGNQVGNPRALYVQFSDLTGPQQNALRNVVTWALNQVKASEGPFV